MSRSFSAILACVFLVIFLAIGFGAGPVQAYTTYQFTATTTTMPNYHPNQTYPGWSIRYVDLDDDQHMSTNELVEGSFVPPDLNWSYNLLDVSQVPAHSNTYPMSPLTDGESVGVWWAWTFDTTWHAGTDPYHTSYEVSFWDYSQTAVVPLPPSVFLLGAGLMGLAAARRKKRSGP